MKEYTLKDFLPSAKLDSIRDWKILFRSIIGKKRGAFYNAGEIVGKVSIWPDLTKEIELELVAPISGMYCFSSAYSYVNEKIEKLVEKNYLICKAFDNNQMLLKELAFKDFLSPTLLEEIKNRKIRFIIAPNNNREIRYSKGDVIAKAIVYYDKIHVEDYYNVELIAPTTAVYDFSDDFLNLTNGNTDCFVEESLNNSIVLCKAFNNYHDWAKYRMDIDCSYAITNDVFNGEKRIVWKYKSFNAFPLGIKGVKPFVILQNSKEQFVFQYPKKGFSLHKLEKEDVFHFVFENGSHLEFQMKSSATKTNSPNFNQVSFSMLPQDIKQFANNNVTAIRCEFKNGDAPLDLEWENETSAIMLKLYFQKYIQALLECGVDIDKIPVANESIKRPINELGDESTDASCFVYLMKDESNGYHKIGISNKPEYRERTLQSEKPTIVLLCAKKFPSRIIAEAIEAALHKAYGNKRLRGEWFELDNKDVTEIVATLS